MMIQLEYDSFQPQYKTPFGAVPQQTPVQFALNVKTSATIGQVTLCIVHDGQWDAEHLLPMTAITATRYQVNFTPTQAGLYFYYFQVSTSRDTVFYGCVDGGYGGRGVQYARREQVQMYQLTTLEAVETLPKSYREGLA